MKKSNRPYYYDPISEGAITALRSIISLAVDNNMIEEVDAERAIKLLDTNPHARLTVLGKRLARLLEHVEEVKSLDSRTEVMSQMCKKEFEGLTTILNWNPEWRKKDESN
jgi:hypothetical protein